MFRKLIKSVSTAWRSKEIAVLVNSVGAVIAASYGFDIQPIIEQVELVWESVQHAASGLAGLMALFAIAAAGKDKEGDA